MLDAGAVQSLHDRGGDRGQTVDLGERVTQHAVARRLGRSAAAARSPSTRQVGVAAQHLGGAGPRDQRRGEHDRRRAGAASNSAVSAAAVVGRSKEMS